MRIQHNIAALNSYRQLGGNNNAVAKNLEKLSSGYKINKAGDDAAGLAISEKMRAQITGLETAQKNAQDGISLVQTAEGALTEVHSMLNRMAELATQSSNGTYDDSIDRANLQAEVDSLRDEINRISESTNFNGINLLDGSLGGAKVTTAQGDVLSTSANIGGTQIAATDATGNVFSVSDGIEVTGATNTDETYVEVSYVDEAGKDQKRIVKFTPNTDKGINANSLADAINADKELRKVFSANVDANGVLNIEGRQVGANAKSRVTGLKTAADPAKVNGAATAGVSNKFSGTLAEGETIKIDGKEFTFTKTAGQAGKFSNATELKALLGNNDYDVAGTITNTSGDVADLVITKKPSGLDAVVESGTGTLTSDNGGKNQELTLGAFDLPEGIERELKLTYKKQDGTANQNLTIKVTGGATKEETAQNILKALQRNADFKTNFGDYDATVDANGTIKLKAKGTGVLKSEITSLEVNKAGKAMTAPTADKLKDTAAIDKHLNLKDKFNPGAMKDGDTIMLGREIYTFRKGALGDDGKTFSDFSSLQEAAAQNGVILEDVSELGDKSALVAKSAARTTFDFDGRIGADVIGGTIDFGGNKFRFVEAGVPSKVEAGIKNIEIAKNATAEEMAKALADAMNGVKTKENEKDETSADVTWKSSLKEGKSGKNTIVSLEADPAGKVDLPKSKLTGFGINLQVGDTNEDYQKVRVSVDSMDATSLGIDKVDITNQTKAAESIKVIKDAINTVSAQRGKLGAVQNRLEHTINNLGVTTENITAAESRIRDTDMAKEMMAYTKNNILVQSAQAMLAQANTLPQGVLQLLQ